MSTICLLGRQPAIGMAELESLYGSAALQPLGGQAALVEHTVDFARLGGTIKCAELITSVDSTHPQKVFACVRRLLPDYVANFPRGKVKLGVSLYGFDVPLPQINAHALTLKRIIKQTGRSVRVVPNTEPALSSAQTYHNALTSDVGCELVFVCDMTKTYIGRVTHVQDIDSYTLRDRGRPRRDAFVGMLPPKLAQVIVNLAVGEMQTERLRDRETEHTIILDPFCGTGVILQEAALMGYDVYGTDISEKMIDYSRANLQWLQKQESLKARKFESKLQIGDATNYKWDFPYPTLHAPRSNTIAIATEAYLGRPIGGQQPTLETLQCISAESNTIVQGFFKNIAPQLPTGSRLCVAVPAWFVANHVHHLPVVAELASLCYRRVSFAHASPDELIYRRDDQITGRELLVLEKTR